MGVNQKPYLDFIVQLSDAHDVAALRRVCQSFAAAQGVAYLIVGVTQSDACGAPGVSALVETLPLDLSMDSLKRRHPNYTPTALELLRDGAAFDCDAPPVSTYRRDYERIWDEHRQFAQCQYFYAVPVEDKGVLRGWAGYFGDRKFATHEAQAALNVLSIAGYERMLQLNILTPVQTPLTRRQADALAYCAQGKSDWEIGEILGIAEATAHEHVEAAKRRLGVHTRIQAAVLAVQRGWIKP